MRAGTLKADEEAAREEIAALRATVAALEAQERRIIMPFICAIHSTTLNTA